MNDLKFSLSLLDRMLKEARRSDLSFAEQVGLYATVKDACREFRVISRRPSARP